MSHLQPSLLSVALGHQRAGFCKQPGLGVPETKLNLGGGGVGGGVGGGGGGVGGGGGGVGGSIGCDVWIN